MTNDKIAEIRARHAVTEVYRQSLTDRVQMHDDRATLLAEVDSQRAENELQRAEIELQRTSRHREARAFEAEHNRLQAALNTARRERDEARAEVERLQGLLKGVSRDMAEEVEKLIRQRKAAAWLASAESAQRLDGYRRLTRERDEARAEVAQLLLRSEVLASHQGSPHREWHSAGAWLFPGDRINVMRAPLGAKP